MTIKNQSVIITGAGRGIGEAAALALAAHGAAVTVAARKHDDAARVADAITHSGGRALPVACDVADDAAVQAAVAASVKAFGPVTALINNAGVIDPIGRLADTDPAAWLRNIDINLIGAFNAIHAVLPQMMAEGAGTIINLSSGAAHKPMEGWSAYCVAKAGLAMLTRSLHLEYHGKGVRSIGFAPGLVDTGMQGMIRASGINPVSQIARQSLSPPAESAAAIVFLCSPGGVAYAGMEVDVRDAAFRAAAGLPPKG